MDRNLDKGASETSEVSSGYTLEEKIEQIRLAIEAGAKSRKEITIMTGITDDYMRIHSIKNILNLPDGRKQLHTLNDHRFGSIIQEGIQNGSSSQKIASEIKRLTGEKISRQAIDMIISHTNNYERWRNHARVAAAEKENIILEKAQKKEAISEIS